MEVTVVRFELYPREEPTGYCVGFAANNRYADCLVPLKEGEEPEYYVNMAKVLLRENLIEMTTPKPALLGMKVSL